MACPGNNCTEKVINLASIYTTYNSDCQEDTDDECGTHKHNALCTVYKGPNLSCSGVNTNDNLEAIIQKLDTKLCTTIGDYSTYNKACLNESVVINTEKDFVEAIANQFCLLKGQFNSFVNTTFTSYQTSVTNQFNAIINPQFTCAAAGITSADNLTTILGKFCTTIGNISGNINLSTANWSQCFTVSTPPSDLVGAFNLLIDQICQVKALAGVTNLPLFDNSTSCIGGTTTDTLAVTINKIKNKICTAPSFDINALAWGCLTKPSSNATDLQNAFQVVLNKLTVITQNLPTYDSGDFTVDALDINNPCAGKTVKLAQSANTDRLVVARPQDTVGGTLQDILIPGNNFNLDFTTTPGKIILSATGGAATDEKVKANVAGGNAGYLDEKIRGGSDNGLSLTTPYDSGTDKVVVTPSIDWPVFVDKILETIKGNADLTTKFCLMVKACPSPCSAPSNIEVTFEP